jgi:WD40 repeat protein
MDALRKHFPWMTEAEGVVLRAELLRRAAELYEQVEAWREAAECWAELGDRARAGELYARGGELGQGAQALLVAGRYAEALELYRAWEAGLLRADVVSRVRALLGQAACHLLGADRGAVAGSLSVQVGQAAYRQARALIDAEGGRDPLLGARCWGALGDYGGRLGRQDLVQAGYEGALARLEASAAGHERLEVGRAYLATLRRLGDMALARRVEERLAEWGAGEMVEEGEPPTYEELVERSRGIRPLRTLVGHSQRVWSVAFSPDGQWLASGSEDNTMRLWEVETGQQVRTFAGHASSVYSVAFSPDGRLLASGSADHTVRLWEVDTGRQVRTLEGHTESVYSVAFSPDRRLLASGSWDNTVRLWEVETGRQVRTLEGHTGSVHSVAFSPDGRLLVSGSADNTMRLWEVETGRETRILEGHTGWVHGLALSPDGRWLASGSGDDTVRLWEVETGSELRKLEGHTTSVNMVAWSSDGSLLISRPNNSPTNKGLDGAVHFWHAASGRIVTTLPQQTAQGDMYWITRALTLSPDGRLLATYAPDTLDVIQLWDISALGVGPKRKAAPGALGHS